MCSGAFVVTLNSHVHPVHATITYIYIYNQLSIIPYHMNQHLSICNTCFKAKKCVGLVSIGAKRIFCKHIGTTKIWQNIVPSDQECCPKLDFGRKARIMSVDLRCPSSSPPSPRSILRPKTRHGPHQLQARLTRAASLGRPKKWVSMGKHQ